MDYATITIVEDDILIVEVAQQGPPGAGGGNGFTSEFTATGTIETIPTRHQKLVYGPYEIEGTLIADGRLVLI